MANIFQIGEFLFCNSSTMGTHTPNTWLGLESKAVDFHCVWDPTKLGRAMRERARPDHTHICTQTRDPWKLQATLYFKQLFQTRLQKSFKTAMLQCNHGELRNVFSPIFLPNTSCIPNFLPSKKTTQEFLEFVQEQQAKTEEGSGARGAVYLSLNAYLLVWLLYFRCRPSNNVLTSSPL